MKMDSLACYERRVSQHENYYKSPTGYRYDLSDFILIYSNNASMYSLTHLIRRMTAMASVLVRPDFPNVETRLYGMCDNNLRGNEDFLGEY
jgi:hypothetical protein